VPNSLVKISDLSFSYRGRNIFSGLTLDISEGDINVIMGPSGTGKTTLLRLIGGQLIPDKGDVVVEGKSIPSLSNKKLYQSRRRMGMLFQSGALLTDLSVFENIAYGNPLASEQAVIAAAKAAAADEFIINLPEGYDAFLGERGVRLSGGQCQRISIARAILKNAPILLLDEATNSLDAESEKLVQNALQRLMKNRTTLVIAHRLATVQQADKIVVMNHGKIDAIGTHQDLLKQNGLYAKLAALQFGEV
jgi:ATP-binding cassette subfamily B protein